METTIPFSVARTKSDIKQIDQLAELLSKLEVPVDMNTLEMFQKLQELAGSRDFHPIYSQINQFVLKLKWAREGCWDSGYIVPWMSLYSHIGINTHLSGIAAQYGGGNTASKDAFKSPLIKSPPNPFGSGIRPVEMNRDEWNQLLLSSLSYNPSNPGLSLLGTGRHTNKRPFPSPMPSLSLNNNLANANTGALTSSSSSNKTVTTSQEIPLQHHTVCQPQKKARLSNYSAATNELVGSVTLSPAELEILAASVNSNLGASVAEPSHLEDVAAAVVAVAPLPPKKLKVRRQNARNTKTMADGAAVPAENTDIPSLDSSLGQAPQVAPAADVEILS